MAEPALKNANAKAVDEILELFREEQPLGLIALEVIVSSRILDAVRPGTKLWKAMEHASQAFSDPGLWQTSPQPLRRIIELTAHEMYHSGSEQECREIAESILLGDPDFLSDVTVPNIDPKRKA